MIEYAVFVLVSLLVSACQYDYSSFIETIQTFREVPFDTIEYVFALILIPLTLLLAHYLSQGKVLCWRASLFHHRYKKNR